VRSKADIGLSRLNLPHATKKITSKKRKLKHKTNTVRSNGNSPGSPRRRKRRLRWEGVVEKKGFKRVRVLEYDSGESIEKAVPIAHRHPTPNYGTKHRPNETPSRSVQPFCRAHRCAQHTDAQTTERATSVTIGLIYAMHAMRPKTSDNNG